MGTLYFSNPVIPCVIFRAQRSVIISGEYVAVPGRTVVSAIPFAMRGIFYDRWENIDYPPALPGIIIIA